MIRTACTAFQLSFRRCFASARNVPGARKDLRWSLTEDVVEHDLQIVHLCNGACDQV